MLSSLNSNVLQVPVPLPKDLGCPKTLAQDWTICLQGQADWRDRFRESESSRGLWPGSSGSGWTLLGEEVESQGRLGHVWGRVGRAGPLLGMCPCVLSPERLP
jgi:hypothetical protein